jgi:hypothetical protein
MNMRIIKMLGLAFIAALAFSSVIATSSFAAEVLFLTSNGEELLFTGIGGLWLWRALEGGVLGLGDCEQADYHGWALHKSPLAHRVTIEFSTKCELTLGSMKLKCTEPIKTKEMLAELGLILTGGNKIVGLLLIPSDGTKLFAELECGGEVTTVEGAVVGEIPEIAGGIDQYNKFLTEIFLVFESENKTENQKYTAIDLLGAQMNGPIGLKFSDFLMGSKGSIEETVHLRVAGQIEICIHS